MPMKMTVGQQRWVVLLLGAVATLVLAGCGGFAEGSSDGSTNPGDANRVTLGGIIFDNRTSDNLTALVWYGEDVEAGNYAGFENYLDNRVEVTYTPDELTSPGLEDNNLPVQIYRTEIYDETGTLWRDYRQTIARSADGEVYLLDFEEVALNQERSYVTQPRLLYPSRDVATDDSVFTDGLGYRWRVESTTATSPNGYSNTRLLTPLSSETGGAVQPGRVLEMSGRMYFDVDVGLVYVREYDFALAGNNIAPEQQDAGWTFQSDNEVPPPPPPAEVTLNGITFSSEDSGELAGLPQLGTLQTAQIQGYGGELVDEELRVQWELRNVTVRQEDGDVVLPVQAQITTRIDLSDVDAPETPVQTLLIAKATTGDAYVLSPDNEGVIGSLASTDVFARGTIVSGDSWRQSDGRTYAVINTSPVSESPSGHDDLTLILEIIADDSGDIAAEDRPRRYYDDRGFAEESVLSLRGRYRIGTGITPPDPEEAPVEFTINGIEFSNGTIADLDGYAQLGTRRQAEIFGYGNRLPEQQLTWRWEDQEITVNAGGSDFTSTVAVRTEVIRDLTDADGRQQPGTDLYLARSTNGHVYRLLDHDDDGVFDRLHRPSGTPAIYAYDDPRVGDQWFHAESYGGVVTTATVEVITNDPVNGSPSGLLNLTLIIGATTDDDQRTYYDAAGLAEFQFSVGNGLFRDNDGDGELSAPSANN